MDKIPCDKEDFALNRTYKLVLDKGMFDAVSAEGVKEFRDNYLTNVRKLLQPDGVLLMATCSNTEEELKEQITKGFYCYNRLTLLQVET